MLATFPSQLSMTRIQSMSTNDGSPHTCTMLLVTVTRKLIKWGLFKRRQNEYLNFQSDRESVFLSRNDEWPLC